MDALKKIYTEIAEKTQAARDRLDHNKEILFDILEKNKIPSIEIHFDGAGDSGGVDNIFLDPGKEVVLLEPVFNVKVLEHISFSQNGIKYVYEKEPSVGDLINSICYDFLEHTNDGWENGGGAHGTVLIDVENKKISMEFYAREEKYFEYEI